MRRAIAALVCVGLAGTQALAQRNPVQENRRNQALNDLRRYHAMLDAYAAGDEQHSVKLLAAPEWTDDRLRRLAEIIDSVADPRAPWDARRYSAAVLVHTDVALELTADNGAAAGMLHVDFASNLVRRALRQQGEAYQRFAEHWYVTVAAWQRRISALGNAERILKTARDQLPDNAGILFASGTLAELVATDYAAAQTSDERGARRGWAFPLERVTKDRNASLGTATGWLRRAAALAPDVELVRVHLGRVLAIRHDDDEALRLLEAVRTQSRDDAIVYLANVFVAGLRVRQGRLDEAVTAFRGAIARFPIGHAAYVGLSEVLQRTGKGDESRELLQRLLGAERGSTREPLWWYLIDPPGVLEERFAVLRGVVRQ
jgi:tetratricopeptide (TPR) repeat protein